MPLENNTSTKLPTLKLDADENCAFVNGQLPRTDLHTLTIAGDGQIE